jgi:hypothetical protein
MISRNLAQFEKPSLKFISQEVPFSDFDPSDLLLTGGIG